jgi:hypothetical protein
MNKILINLFKMKKLGIKKANKVIKLDDSLSGMQKLIFEDVKNINKFNIIIEEFILALQNQDSEKVKQYYEVIKDILTYFLIKNNSILSKDLTNFLNTKAKMLIHVLNDSFDGDDYKLNATLFKYIFELLNFIDDPTEFLTLLAETFIYDDELTFEPKNIKLLSSKLNKKNLLLKNFTEIIAKTDTELTCNVIYNIFNFLISVNLDSVDEPNEIKKNYQDLIVKIINSKETSQEIIAELMLNLNKSILNNLENPLILADYLITIYENSLGDEFDLKILSLSGLFILLSKYKLDYPNYFTILYRTISITYNNGCQVITVFDSQYKNRFIKILDLSLRTPSVSIIVILSFIKVSC